MSMNFFLRGLVIGFAEARLLLPGLAVVSAAEDPGKSDGPITNHESRLTNHVPLDCPHYTRPAEFRGWNVPEVLLGGNHEEIRRWRLQKAREKTRRNRPDLLSAAQQGET